MNPINTNYNNLAYEQPSIYLNKLDRDGHTLFTKVVADGDLARVSDFINNSANVNHQNLYGQAPLYVAVNHGYLEIASLLLKRKPDTELTDSNGDTPLTLAAKMGNRDIVGLLLENNANVNHANNNHDTPLILATFDLLRVESLAAGVLVDIL